MPAEWHLIIRNLAPKCATNRQLLFECRSTNRMALNCDNFYRCTFASKRQTHSRQFPNSSMSAKLDSNLIVDENRQPIGRPWLSLAVHAACSQILTIKGHRFALSGAKTVGLILTIKCQKSPRNRDS